MIGRFLLQLPRNEIDFRASEEPYLNVKLWLQCAILIIAFAVPNSGDADPLVVLSTTNLPLSSSVTIFGPYNYLAGQRFTTDGSTNTTIRGLGVYVTDVIDQPNHSPANLSAWIVPDQNGHPSDRGIGAVGALGSFYPPFSGDINYFDAGDGIALNPNTSYWALFYIGGNSSEAYPWSSVSLGTISTNIGGNGSWLHSPADYVSADLELDSHYDTGQFRLTTNSLIRMIIATEQLLPGSPTPPNITVQPQSITSTVHDSVSFSVGASGSPTLRYQWLFNGTNILGATSSTLVVPDVTQSCLGNYSVIVTNAFGTNVSSNALLSMPPFIAGPFPGAVTIWGKPATLSVQAWGSDPLSYQWLKDGAIVAGGTNAVLSFSAVQLSDAGIYSVIVSNFLGTATNTSAQVIVNPANIDLGLRSSVTIEGVVGYTYGIDYTTNLTDTNAWVRITNLTLSEPLQIWVDTSVDVRAGKSRYYRVVAQ